MLHWYMLLFLMPSSSHAIGHPRYECGEHGRFEYCIDGVPGCIVGCHCHPGYYFDTESKICEPNAKLVQEYRRMFFAEPTRVDIPMTPDSIAETMPTPTTINPLDNQVDAIAKDTDDLGDWLYNQFFKTIEGQVVNGTEKDKPTRRSDIGSFVKKPRRFHRKGRNSNKKIKIKNTDLRRKLLRITEDDSLFDSNSDSEETSGSSSSDSKSDTTAEDENSPNPHPNDKEHGHRKILVINKKPKPPLPSFIFLPNIETPFYPPIGLPPPPPAIPMFPMVPVPPMPVFPFPPGPAPCPPDNNKRKDDQEKKDNENEEKEKKEKEEKEEKEKKENEDKEDKEKENKNKEKNSKEAALRFGRGMMFRSQNPKRGQRKTFRMLPEQMPYFPGDVRKRNKKPLNRNFIYRKPETPSFDELNPQDVPIHDEIKIAPIEDSQVPAPSPAEDVDFKYLSQLIHKVNPNLTHDDLIHKRVYGRKIPNPPPLRRTFETRYYNYDTQPEQHPTQQNQQQEYETQQKQPTREIDDQRPATQFEQDDSYYANLGQQIASLIRKVNSAGQPNEGLENTPPQPVINENSHSSRSYWERSVRSPLQHFRPNMRQIDYIQRNYESLLNLERKVEFVASTEHPLSLQEIENIVFLMDRAKSQLQDKIKNIKTFKAATQNLNINLLPRQSELSTMKQLSKESFNLLPRQSENLHTKQFSKGTFAINNSDDVSILPQKSEISNEKSAGKVSVPKKSQEDNINFMPRKTQLPNNKRRYKHLQPVVLNKIEPIENKSVTADEHVNTNNPQYNLRGILMHNFRNVASNNDLVNVLPNTDHRHVAPDIGFNNALSNTDLRIVAPNIDSRNVETNTDFRNVAFDTDFRNVVPSSEFKNYEVNTNFKHPLPDADFSNTPKPDFKITIHDGGIRYITPDTRFKNGKRKDLPYNELSNLIQKTDPTSILSNTNILRFLLQKGISKTTQRNHTWNEIQNRTKIKIINNSWNQENIRKKQAVIKKKHKLFANILEQETYKKPISPKTPQNEISASFVMPFLSNVKPIPKLPMPNTRRKYQINAKPYNSKDINFMKNNISQYGFLKETLPFELSRTIHFDKPGPSYFHHELHHFDYFD